MIRTCKSSHVLLLLMIVLSTSCSSKIGCYGFILGTGNHHCYNNHHEAPVTKISRIRKNPQSIPSLSVLSFSDMLYGGSYYNRNNIQRRRLQISNSNDNNNSVVKDNEEPLSLMFQRAVALQRAGEYQQSLQEYETFVKAAKQCQVESSMYAEVLCNMGSIYLKLGGNDEKAQELWEQALKERNDTLGTAHVNLALLALKQGSQTTDPQKGYDALQKAQTHCQKVLDLPIDKNENVQPKQMAKRLLEDVNRMLSQMQQ